MEIKISEILHLAADKYLSPANKRSEWITGLATEWYSCCAVAHVIDSIVPDRRRFAVRRIVMDGLNELGCITYSLSLFKNSSNPQGDRYMWLKFAAIIAEEQEAAGYKLEI